MVTKRIILELMAMIGFFYFFFFNIRVGNQYIHFFGQLKSRPNIIPVVDMQRRLEEQGVYAAPTTPEQFAAFIKSETIKWAKAVKYSGATVE